MKHLASFFAVFVLAGCGAAESLQSISALEENPVDWAGLQICSHLDFKGIEWSEEIAVEERDPFALALNITGSFEGVKGWANLTNNFDGQGLSMGLLQQNLGQGTLQPLWIEMRSTHPERLQSLFSRANFSSLSRMLDQWGSVLSARALIDLEAMGYSELDEPAEIGRDAGAEFQKVTAAAQAVSSRNQKSVQWAVANLYKSSKFKPDWLTQLKDLAASAEYRTLQLAKAERLHEKALRLAEELQFNSVKSYLFFFDIVVQNGGIPQSVRSEYQSWLRRTPSASEDARLLKILELRLRLVRQQFKTDVRRRKEAIIKGYGVVHGSKRNLEKEYCYDY